MAISDKLTYLNTTKTLIKDNLNLGGANISNEPFRVYSSKLIDIYKDFLAHGTDTLWNNWNKVNGTGESLTLNNTIKGKMKIGLKGNTSQEGTPTPDSPQDIHTVSGDNTIKVYGKNLVEAIITHANISAEGVIVYHYDYDIHIAKIVQGKTYTMTTTVANDKVLGFFINYPTINSTTYNNSRVIQSSYTFTAPITGYVAFRSATGYSTPMLNEGTTALPYEPYQSTTYPINLGSMELCKIGDYQDSIVKDNGKWYLNKKIGKVVLDGSETWSEFFSTQGFYRYTPTAPSLNTTNTINCICDYYKGTTRNEIRNLSPSANNKCSIYGSELVLVNTSITSINDFKTWLSTHNTIVYYVLATPTITEITDTTLTNQLEAIKLSYNEQTNITQTNDDKPFILDVTALGELEI
jgi:hypothetical protein